MSADSSSTAPALSTMPSTGTTSPPRTSTRSPTSTRSAGTSTRSLSRCRRRSAGRESEEGRQLAASGGRRPLKGAAAREHERDDGRGKLLAQGKGRRDGDQRDDVDAHVAVAQVARDGPRQGDQHEQRRGPPGGVRVPADRREDAAGRQPEGREPGQEQRRELPPRPGAACWPARRRPSREGRGHWPRGALSQCTRTTEPPVARTMCQPMRSQKGAGRDAARAPGLVPGWRTERLDRGAVARAPGRASSELRHHLPPEAAPAMAFRDEHVLHLGDVWSERAPVEEGDELGPLMGDDARRRGEAGGDRDPSAGRRFSAPDQVGDRRGARRTARSDAGSRRRSSPPAPLLVAEGFAGWVREARTAGASVAPRATATTTTKMTARVQPGPPS